MASIERDPETGFLVGHVPGFPGAHSQGATLDELRCNLKEIIEMLLEDGEPQIKGAVVGSEPPPTEDGVESRPASRSR